jgi:hypothetical protein
MTKWSQDSLSIHTRIVACHNALARLDEYLAQEKSIPSISRFREWITAEHKKAQDWSEIQENLEK